jgi:hypothetical protein
MEKIIRKILIVLILTLGFGFFAIPSARAIEADELVVEYWSDITQSWLPLSGPIFNETNFLPGQSVIRLIRVTNNSGQTQRIATEAINVSDPNQLGDVLNLEIKEGGVTHYNKTLSTFFNEGEVFLSDLAGNGTQTQYDFIVNFNSGAGDPFEGKSLRFDILIGFQGTEGGLPPAPPGGEGGGGDGGGGLPPGLSILDESVRVTEIGETSVTIIWTTSYFSTSQVIYGAEGESHTLDLSDNTGTPPKYGYEHTTPEYNVSPKVTAHFVTITGLTPATTYYFRAVSHASLAISREFSFTTSAGSTEEKIGEIKGEEPILPPPEGTTVEGKEQELVEKPSEEFSGGLGNEPTGEKETGKLPMEGKKAWWEGLIDEGLLAAIGLKPLNSKLILFLILIILIFLLVSKIIIRRKKEIKNKV